MTFLQLVRLVHERSGLQGTIDSVVGQTGIRKTVVDVTSEAWKTIQGASDSYTFRKDVTSFNTVVGKSTYTPAEYMVNSSNGAADLSYAIMLTCRGSVLTKMPKEYLMMVDPSASQAAPAWWIRDDSSENIIMNAADRQYTVNVLFYKNIQSLVGDGDVPCVPEEFHPIIVEKALEKMASDAILGNVGLAQEAHYNYKRLLQKFNRAFIPGKRVVPRDVLI